MNVLFATAEMAPLAKVGGVGDVAGSLPRALRGLGLDVRIALPFHGSIVREALSLERVAEVAGGALWQTNVREVPVYLVEHESFLGRERVYGYEDDLDRFLAFTDTLLASAGGLGWQPDAVHLNDWHTGFIAARLANGEHPWAAAARVCTIHNLGYRGDFSAEFAQTNSLGAADGSSALEQCIASSDIVSTVSPTYAKEVLTPQLGEGLDGVLRGLGGRLAGILNGIDVEAADPAIDRHLAANFDAGRLEPRAENKRALQRELGLPEDDVALVGMVARLVVQKGADLTAAAIEQLLGEGQALQIAVLGEGDEQYEHLLLDLASRHPEHVGVRIAFDLRLSQLIYGGGDMLLMPSRYEPCGLGQMFAMRYGSVPVVHRTGGLADSVRQFDASADSGTGFLFDKPNAEALAATLREALAAYRDRESWRRLQQRCMAEDFSWARSARAYVRLYERAIELSKQRAAAERAR